MVKRICSIALTFLLVMTAVQAQAGTLSSEPANVSTESMIKNLLGLDDVIARVLRQYSAGEQSENNSFILPVQIQLNIDPRNNNYGVLIQYQITF